MSEIVKNRHELVVLYDVKNANPNGDPLSANNRPRIDEPTHQALVTDVRLKRFIRDQLQDEGENIYIRGATENEKNVTRESLFDEIVEGYDGETEADYFREFLNRAIDVRMFGGTFSFDTDYDYENLNDELEIENFPGQLLGAVQFSIGYSLNKVQLSNSTRKLTTVIASGQDKSQGTFAEDNRLHYALVNFHGTINENAAKTTKLTESDVTKLDKTIWSSLKTQTLTRSKKGHEPRFYARIEYSEDEFQIGSLSDALSIDSENSVEDPSMRNISDIVVDATEFIELLEENTEKIKEITINISKFIEFSVDGEIYRGTDFVKEIERLGVNVNGE